MDVAFALHLIQQLISTLIVHLYFLQVFLLCSFIAWKNQSARHAESPVGLFFVQELPRQYPSVKESLPLEPFCWFLGDADLPQLVTRQGEHLTSGRTFLSLFPKINRIQVVSFNGAGFCLILALYALKFAKYPIAKVIPRQRRKVTRKWAKSKLAWARYRAA